MHDITMFISLLHSILFDICVEVSLPFSGLSSGLGSFDYFFVFHYATPHNILLFLQVHHYAMITRGRSDNAQGPKRLEESTAISLWKVKNKKKNVLHYLFSVVVRFGSSFHVSYFERMTGLSSCRLTW